MTQLSKRIPRPITVRFNTGKGPGAFEMLPVKDYTGKRYYNQSKQNGKSN